MKKKLALLLVALSCSGALFASNHLRIPEIPPLNKEETELKDLLDDFEFIEKIDDTETKKPHIIYGQRSREEKKDEVKNPWKTYKNPMEGTWFIVPNEFKHEDKSDILNFSMLEECNDSSEKSGEEEYEDNRQELKVDKLQQFFESIMNNNKVDYQSNESQRLRDVELEKLNIDQNDNLKSITPFQNKNHITLLLLKELFNDRINQFYLNEDELEIELSEESEKKLSIECKKPQKKPTAQRSTKKNNRRKRNKKRKKRIVKINLSRLFGKNFAEIYDEKKFTKLFGK